MRQPTNNILDYDNAFTALCIMENISEALMASGQEEHPMDSFQSQYGSGQIKDDVISHSAIRLNKAHEKATTLYGNSDYYPFDLETVPKVMEEIFKTEDLHNAEQSVWNRILDEIIWTDNFNSLFNASQELRDGLTSVVVDLADIYQEFAALTPANAAISFSQKHNIPTPA